MLAHQFYGSTLGGLLSGGRRQTVRVRHRCRRVADDFFSLLLVFAPTTGKCSQSEELQPLAPVIDQLVKTCATPVSTARWRLAAPGLFAIPATARRPGQRHLIDNVGMLGFRCRSGVSENL